MLQVSVRARRALVREMYERSTSVYESLREKILVITTVARNHMKII